MRGYGQSGKGERGTALVITLLIITTLVGLTVAFSEDSNIELSLAGLSRDAFLAHLAATAGSEAARALIEADEDRAVDSLREEWAHFGKDSLPHGLQEGATISGGIVDENGKFNLNGLLNQAGEIDEKQEARLVRLFTLLGLDEGRVNPVLDWLDKDDEKRLEGAESDYYRSLPHPYSCANGPFATLGQLFLVKGMRTTPGNGQIAGPGGEGMETLKLRDYLTIYGDGKINLNTASQVVLRCLDEELDSALVEAILAYRQKEDFKTVDDLKKISGMSDEIFGRIKESLTVKSSCFSLRIEGTYGDSTSSVNAFLLYEGGKSKLIYWRAS